MSNWVDIFWTLFCGLCFAGTLIPLTALVVKRSMRNASASVRHRLWLVTVIGLLLFPGTRQNVFTEVCTAVGGRNVSSF
ncbi:MAG: hypothetical protein LBT89_05220 [Planctomycetaceae bacterium]|jgi:hypothetical protein|nr:hypothetical protein [Planctomycetaceae bacterium]